LNNNGSRTGVKEGMGSMEKATFAGGCFWCTEAVFRRLKGVSSVVPGYTGGTKENPTYQEVCTGTTGHAEAVEIAFDPSVIAYKTLLEIFFHLHDPTSRNQQGNDVGPQYRSAVFTHSEEQRDTVKALISKLDSTRAFSRPIVTEVTPVGPFYPAEEHHKEYYEKNSYQPYCQYVIDPKISKLLSEYGSNVKDEYTSK